MGELDIADTVGTWAPRIGGDFVTGGIMNRLLSNGDGKPSYDETIQTGPAFQARTDGSQGLQAPNTQGLGWMDMTGQGDNEQFVGQNVGQMAGPSASAGFNQQAQQFMQDGSASAAVNANPNFDQYYDRARERQAGAANDQMAARGGYGSSAGMDMMMQGQADINAQQANREADYRLQSAAQADTAQQGLYGLGANAATAADSAGVSRFAAGANATAGSQNARERRVGDAFNRVAANATNKNNAASPYQLGQIGADATGLGNQIALATGTTGEALNQSNQNVQQGFQYGQAGVEGAATALDMYKTAAGGM